MLAGLYRTSCRCLGTNTTDLPARPRSIYCSVNAFALLRFASTQLIRRWPSASTGASYNVMAPKQATLGKFFGVKAGAPARQTTLAFATKAGSKETSKAGDEGSEGDASTKENSDPEKGKTICYSPAPIQSLIVDS
ncbi:hypothetical protein GGI43DRAFT_401074 [Trichoderma evansii]